MKIEVLPIDSLKPYENNAKIHTPAQVAQIAASIQEFGNNDPIAVDENNMVIKGARPAARPEEPGRKRGGVHPAGRPDGRSKARIHTYSQPAHHEYRV